MPLTKTKPKTLLVMKKNKEVYVVAKPATEGFEYFGIFSTPELAQAEVDSHPGSFAVPVTLDTPTSF